MSLLNDALRAAEQRQNRPDVPNAYPGGSVQGGQGGNRWLILFVLFLVLVIAAVGVYWYAAPGAQSPVPQPSHPVADSGADGGSGKVARPEQNVTSEESMAQGSESGYEEPDPIPEPKSVQKPEQKPEMASVSETEEVARPDSSNTNPVAETNESQPIETATTEKPSEPETQQGQTTTPVVKTTPQSPEAIDRKAARDIEALLSDGRMVEAERRLASLTQSQLAPRSRFEVARALLVEGEANRALAWLPESAAASNPRLRMLRARALHANGDLQAALAVLKSRIPTVADQPEYRVTLATLLQQHGDSQDAASHWAELIAWDDTQAPWWVGLAIALEDQGQTRSAARAYEQAAALPGLPAALAEYVQSRLRSLRAG